MSIKNFTDEQLLLELISRNKGFVSPKKVTYETPHSEFIVGIGCDHSVAINIDDDALYELNTGTFNQINKGMSFGSAVSAMKDGRRVARKGWNGRGMWLILVPGSNGIRPVAGTPYSNAGLTGEVNINPHIDMYTATGEMQPGWLASQTDMLATDWEALDPV